MTLLVYPGLTYGNICAQLVNLAGSAVNPRGEKKKLARMARRVHQGGVMAANAVKSAPGASSPVDDLLCPNCRSKKVLPSHHLSLYDYTLRAIGVRPFRRQRCYQRFRRWLVWTWRCGG